MTPVSKKIAVGLKEIGFDVPTSKYINIITDFVGSGTSVNWNTQDVVPDVCALPTIDEAARWLRETHGLHLYCLHIVNGGWLWTVASTSNMYSWNDDEEYPDHDTALTASIEKAIEIVKSRITSTGPAANTE